MLDIRQGPIEPFFVVGAQRSGTTMLRLMLNRHPALSVPYETEFLRPYGLARELGDLSIRDNAERVLRALGEEYFTRQGRIVGDFETILGHPIFDYASLLKAVFDEYARHRGKRRWGIKTPDYGTELDAIWELFPGCRIIHLVRDGRDVAVSLGALRWGSTHVPIVAEDWKWKVMLARKMGNMIPGHYLEILYEDLVREPAAQLRTISDFLGESYDPEMLRYPESAADEMPTKSLQWHGHSVSPPDKSKISIWKKRMPVADQILFEEIAGDALEQFGYERTKRAPTWSSKLKRVYYYTLKRW